MKGLKTIYMLSIALLLTLATNAVAITIEPCHTTLTSGSGQNYMQVCITSHGNLVNFISPSGQDHIFMEGYAICDNPGNAEFVSGYDTGGGEEGCGSPTISQPNGANTLPLTITRSCHCIKFKQVFSRDTTEKDITITMTLTNICNFTLYNNRVSRYFDGDINGDVTYDVYDASVDSVWARDIEALSLTALTFGTAHESVVEYQSNWTPFGSPHTATGCSFSGIITPTAPGNTGNWVGRIQYYLGTLNAGQSKTVKAVYRRQ